MHKQIVFEVIVKKNSRNLLATTSYKTINVSMYLLKKLS